MIESVVIIILCVAWLGIAEFKHQKTGNGKRFDRVCSMLDLDKK